MRAVILFVAFIYLTPFYPARGLWLSGPHGEKVAHVSLTSLDTASQQLAESTEVREQVRDKQVFHIAITALSFKTLRPCSSTLFVKPPQSIEIKICASQQQSEIRPRVALQLPLVLLSYAFNEETDRSCSAALHKF